MERKNGNKDANYANEREFHVIGLGLKYSSTKASISSFSSDEILSKKSSLFSWILNTRDSPGRYANRISRCEHHGKLVDNSRGRLMDVRSLVFNHPKSLMATTRNSRFPIIVPLSARLVLIVPRSTKSTSSAMIGIIPELIVTQMWASEAVIIVSSKAYCKFEPQKTYTLGQPLSDPLP